MLFPRAPVFMKNDGKKNASPKRGAKLFFEYKQVLVCYEQKVVFHTVCFPISSCFAVVLFLDYQFFKFKSCILKNPHYLKRHRYHTAFLSCIAHKNSTELVLFQHTVALSGNLFHFLQKVFDFQ